MVKGVRKLFNWQVLLGVCLLSMSAIVYVIHYYIFRDAHHIFLYLIGDIAFVFIEMLLVVLILHRLLGYREKMAMLNKLNMAIGSFYSEVGLGLLRMLAAADEKSKTVSDELILSSNWTAREFQAAGRKIKKYEYEVQIKQISLESLKDYLNSKRDFLLRLLENPNLLEHESFTNLLWAVFHLTEELAYRRTFQGLTVKDSQHLAGDIKRVYQLLVSEWLDYMKHLQKDYPYLFSLAVRTNPFDPNACVEIK